MIAIRNADKVRVIAREVIPEQIDQIELFLLSRNIDPTGIVLNEGDWLVSVPGQVEVDRITALEFLDDYTEVWGD